MVILTEREQDILKLKIKGVNNAEIARQVNTSPQDISQTFTRISQKIINVNDTLNMFQEIGLAEKSPPIRLTSKGLSSLQKLKEQRKDVKHKSTKAISRIRVNHIIAANRPVHGLLQFKDKQGVKGIISQYQLLFGSKEKLIHAQLTALDLRGLDIKEIELIALAS